MVATSAIRAPNSTGNTKAAPARWGRLAEMEKQWLTYQNQLQQQTTDNRIVDEKSSRMKSESEHISKGWTR